MLVLLVVYDVKYVMFQEGIILFIVGFYPDVPVWVVWKECFPESTWEEAFERGGGNMC